MDSQIFYRPTDLSTAEYLEKWLGKILAYAQSITSNPDGEEKAQGRSEQAVPLQTAQELMQFGDEAIILFHRQLPPIKAGRVDWRGDSLLENRRQVSPPILSALPAVDEDTAAASAGAPSAAGYIE